MKRAQKRRQNSLLPEEIREQLRAYKHRKEIPVGTAFYWWPGKDRHITSGYLPRNYMFVSPDLAKTHVLRVCRVEESENGYGPFVDYYLSPNGQYTNPSECVIVNGPDAFRLTRLPDKKPAFTEEAVLFLMAKGECDLFNGWRNMLTTTDLMRTFFVTRYAARRMLHGLLRKGLVQPDVYGGQREDGTAFCLHGYVLTESGRKRPEYKKAAYQEAKLDAECFDSGRSQMPGYYHARVKTPGEERNALCG